MRRRTPGFLGGACGVACADEATDEAVEDVAAGLSAERVGVLAGWLAAVPL